MQAYLDTGERHLDWSGADLPAEHANGDEVLVSISFGEFEHHGQRYFTGVITPADIDDEVVETLADVHDRLVDAAERVDDEGVADAVAELEEVVTRLEGT